jgi:hypothetical protein
MRHIKKYNEDLFYWGDDKPKVVFNIEDHIDIEHINGCFSNLIDEADIDYEVAEEDNDNKQSYELIFYIDDIVKYRNGHMEKFDQVIKHVTEVKDLLEEIKSSVRKVQIEYPGLVPDLDIEHERDKNADWTELVPINCISVKYTENSVTNYLKNKK